MSKITRRDFIRIASLMGGASLFVGCSLLDDHTQVPEYIKGAPAVDPVETLLGVETKYSVCDLCSGSCGISLRIAQGSLVKIGGNPYHPVSTAMPATFATPLNEALKLGGSVCAVGSSGVQTLYDPFRIQKPLKRVGARGSGKWTAINWDQAISEIAEGGNIFGEGSVDGLKRIKDSGDGPTLLTGRVDWGSLVFLENFLSQFPRATMARTKDVIVQDEARRVVQSVFASKSGSLDADYTNAGFLLSFGLAPLDSGRPIVSMARQIANSRLESPCMAWVVVDPRLSTSASKADHWVPIFPGTDDKLAIAVAKALFEKHSESLKQPDEELHSLTGKYSFEELAAGCGVKQSDIFIIADLMSKAGPKSAALCGESILQQPNGAQTCRLILALNSLVGSTPGSGGLLSPDNDLLDDLRLSLLGSETPKFEISQLPAENRSLIMWQADPVYFEQDKTAKLLSDRKVNPLFVSIDKTITQTSAYADYILPDTTYLERWDICSLPPSINRPGFGARSPVVGGLEPESGRYFPIFSDNLIMEDILIRLGSSLNLPYSARDKDGRLPNSWQFYQKAFLAAANHIGRKYEISGQTTSGAVNDIIDRGGIFPSAKTKIPFSPSSTPGQPTVKKSWTANPEINQASSGEDLILVEYTLPFHRSPRSGINSWLLEILPENRLVINPQDAAKLKIKQGAELIVQTSVSKASARVRAFVAPGIRPGVVALANGFGYKGSGSVQNSIDALQTPVDKTRGIGANPAVFTGPYPIRVKVNKA
ncbi:MAG: molybdopterin-dependent oxidoreductase [Desulfomonilaceae bacterium]